LTVAYRQKTCSSQLSKILLNCGLLKFQVENGCSLNLSWMSALLAMAKWLTLVTIKASHPAARASLNGRRKFPRRNTQIRLSAWCLFKNRIPQSLKIWFSKKVVRKKKWCYKSKKTRKHSVLQKNFPKNSLCRKTLSKSCKESPLKSRQDLRLKFPIR
jgi:hypothetical protein